MSCSKTRKHLPALLDGALPAPLAGRLQEHLQGCPACQQARDRLQAALRAVDELPRLRASADFDGAFARRLQDARRSRRLAAPPPRRPFWRIPLLAAAGASACAAVLLAVVLTRRGEPPAPGDPGGAATASFQELSAELDLVEEASALEEVQVPVDPQVLQELQAVVELDSAEDFEVVQQLDTLMEDDR